MIEDSLKRIAIALEALAGERKNDTSGTTGGVQPDYSNAAEESIPGEGNPQKLFPETDISREALTGKPAKAVGKKEDEESQEIRALLKEHGVKFNARLGLKRLKEEKRKLMERLNTPVSAPPVPVPDDITLDMVVRKIREYHTRFQNNSRTKNLITGVGKCPAHLAVSTSNVPEENWKNLYTAAQNEMEGEG